MPIYSVSIGNASVKQEEDGYRLLARWAVKFVEHDDAPQFKGFSTTGKSNMMVTTNPAVWDELSRSTGLYELFFGEYGRMERRPGCVKIDDDDVAEVKKALALWQKTREQNGIATQAGWGKEYDCTLARLLWLEYWMAWAVENCEIPAIENS